MRVARSVGETLGLVFFPSHYQGAQFFLYSVLSLVGRFRDPMITFRCSLGVPSGSDTHTFCHAS
jgi:hypothetical protein